MKATIWTTYFSKPNKQFLNNSTMCNLLTEKHMISPFNILKINLSYYVF